jgi:hypothetical protein
MVILSNLQDLFAILMQLFEKFDVSWLLAAAWGQFLHFCRVFENGIHVLFGTSVMLGAWSVGEYKSDLILVGAFIVIRSTLSLCWKHGRNMSGRKN